MSGSDKITQGFRDWVFILFYNFVSEISIIGQARNAQFILKSLLEQIAYGKYRTSNHEKKYLRRISLSDTKKRVRFVSKARSP